MTKPLLVVAAFASTLSLSAFAAAPSSPSEYRGYSACLASVPKQFETLTPTRDYYLSRTAEGRTYYINARHWHDGEWVSVGLRCDTTVSGREVLSSTVTANRFAIADRRSVQVASQ
ncbi:MAG: hypothetical protein R3E82_20915 [Pseudomonadales bacterium]